MCLSPVERVCLICTKGPVSWGAELHCILILLMARKPAFQMLLSSRCMAWQVSRNLLQTNPRGESQTPAGTRCGCLHRLKKRLRWTHCTSQLDFLKSRTAVGLGPGRQTAIPKSSLVWMRSTGAKLRATWPWVSVLHESQSRLAEANVVSMQSLHIGRSWIVNSFGLLASGSAHD